MDSINKNQSEENHENLTNRDATKKIQELIKEVSTCFFCTHASGSDTGGVRPMSVQKVDDDGDIWFLSAKDSHKNKEISIDPGVKLYFIGSAQSDFMQLDGQATINDDKAKIKELWQPILKTWFTDGVDDSRISVIKVTPSTGYYWDTRHGKAIAGVKILIGAITGKTFDDSIEGKLKLS